MKDRILLIAMLSLACWVCMSAIRIERVNAQAGFYLPRQDNGDDGKWRVSPDSTPRDRLRELVMSIGLLQYVFAPILLSSGYYFLFHRSSKMRVFLGAFCGIVGVSALILAVYRGYYSSLGW